MIAARHHQASSVDFRGGMLSDIQQVILKNNETLTKNFEQSLKRSLLIQSGLFDQKINELDKKIVTNYSELSHKVAAAHFPPLKRGIIHEYS